MFSPFLRSSPPGRRFIRLAVLVATASWLGALAPAPAQAGFKFQDYGAARSKLKAPDEIKAVAALLVDAKTGEVLYARNPNQRLLPASTTKLMTALIVFEKIGLKGNVKVTVEDTLVEPSSVR